MVGAPFSDQTFYFRSRPVVRVDAQVRMETPDGIVDPDFRNCTLAASGLPVACFPIEACLHYEGEQADPTLGKCTKQVIYMPVLLSIVINEKHVFQKSLPELTIVLRSAEMEITFKLDSKKTVQPRLYFLIDEGQSELTQIIALQMRKRVCKRNYVYLQVLPFHKYLCN